MCYLGIQADHFNPKILYILKQKYNTNSRLTYHAHDYVSIIYILSGSCTYTIQGKSYAVKKGDVIICNPGIFHGKNFTNTEEVSEFQVGFHNIHLEHLPKEYLIQEDACPVIQLTTYEQDFYNVYSEIIVEQEKNEPGVHLSLKILIMKLIVILLKETYPYIKKEEHNYFNFESYDRTTIVNTLLTYFNENYMNKISLDKISKNMYLSPVYISKIFKEETGETPINYLIKIRLEKAKELLEEDRLSIKEVAQNIGYNDAYYFSRLFKKYYGCPPTQYRNTFLSQNDT